LTSRIIRIRKHDLVNKLQTVEPHPHPNVVLEQYTTPADLAAEILFSACYEYGDIEGKSVLDLGTGTGRLAIGASILGASHAIGIDLDKSALKVAMKSCRRLEVKVDWILGDVESLGGQVDTIVMNPPFGTKRPHADTQFLQVAVRLAKIAYSVHKSSTRRYLTHWLHQHHAEAHSMAVTKIEIPHQFPFHKERRRQVNVDVVRVIRT